MEHNRLHVVQGKYNLEQRRIEYAIKNMINNKAYKYALNEASQDNKEELLNLFKQRYKSYRDGWRGNPEYAIDNKLGDNFYQKTGYPPLCVDIETAATCDLACLFCYRQFIITPDRLMKEELFYRIIDECEALGVPSIKLNWQGEPLLHPKLTEFIDYSKQHGILETIINTNAVTLTESKSKALIEAGLDTMIYSFDGGTRETYEKMRPGRFKVNKFDEVYQNIIRFNEIRRQMGSPFPRTKIQMILTKDTFNEQDSFFEMFSDYVDDVSVKVYSERGAGLDTLEKDSKEWLVNFLKKNNLPLDSAYLKDKNGNIFISLGRIPCEQPFQRLMITYNGRVSMCCYDWGSQYPIGCIDEQAIIEQDKAYYEVWEKIKKVRYGYQYMSEAKMPNRYLALPNNIQSLKEIWSGDILNNVRKLHIGNQLDKIPICKNCLFKETYKWRKVDS